jgi:Fur family transcriptional regulator, peroxide stress response regulator
VSLAPRSYSHYSACSRLDVHFRISIILIIVPERKTIQKAEQAIEPGLTRQRKVVLDVIRRSDTHPTAAEVFAKARKQMPVISVATVYNSLRYLKEVGLVREIASFGKCPSRYDGETDRHDHAVCSACGNLVDFDLPGTVELMRSAARASRFKPKSVHLTLYGLCPKCS